MKIDLEEFPTVGEDFHIVTIDLLMYEEGNYTPLINYLNTDDEEEKVKSGMTMVTGMSFDSKEAAAVFFRTLIENGFFLSPVSSIGFVVDSDNNITGEFNWEEILPHQTAPAGVSIH